MAQPDNRKKALQNPDQSWRQNYRDYTGRRGTLTEKNNFKRDYVSEENVDARMGEGAYQQMLNEAEQRLFGTRGVTPLENRTRKEQKEYDRFKKRFDRNLRNGKLQPRSSASNSSTQQVNQSSTTIPVQSQEKPLIQSRVVFPALYGFNSTPRFNFSQAWINSSQNQNTPYAGQEEHQKQNDIANQNIYKPDPIKATTSDVANIQRKMGVPVTGIWDDSTTEAVKKWQGENGLELTGMWDQATTNAYDAFQKDKEILRQSLLRTRFGFADENAVKEWLLANGLEGTGQLDQSSIGKWNELSRPKAGSNTQPNPFVGEKSYMTEQDARYAFANLYNKYLGDKGLSRTDYFSNVGYSNATKELEGYDEAWNQFISQYDNHGYPGIFGKRYTLKEKLGGKMNRINYFQQGGAAPQQQNMQQQVMQLVQAAMQGDKKATQTIQQVIQAAEQGDQQAQQIAQMIQQVMEQVKGQAVSAKWGSKLGYIKSLKYAKGGKTCPSCQNGGKPLETPPINKSLKKPIKKVEEKACGGKTKKR